MPRSLPVLAYNEIADVIAGIAGHYYVSTIEGNRADTGEPFSLSSGQVYTFDEDGDPVENDFIVKIKSVDTLRLAFGSATDRITIGIENVSGEYRPSWFYGSTVRVGVYIEQFDRIGTARTPFRSVFVPFFQGVVVGADDTDNLLKLNVVGEAQSKPCAATRTQSRRCPWKFKSVECGYSGPETTCSKEYDDATAGCEFYENQHRFGGIPNPDLNQNLINAQAGVSYGPGTGGGFQGGGGGFWGGGIYRDPFEYLNVL